MHFHDNITITASNERNRRIDTVIKSITSSGVIFFLVVVKPVNCIVNRYTHRKMNHTPQNSSNQLAFLRVPVKYIVNWDETQLALFNCLCCLLVVWIIFCCPSKTSPDCSNEFGLKSKRILWKHTTFFPYSFTTVTHFTVCSTRIKVKFNLQFLLSSPSIFLLSCPPSLWSIKFRPQ